MGGKVLTFNYLIKYPTLHGFNIFIYLFIIFMGIEDRRK